VTEVKIYKVGVIAIDLAAVLLSMQLYYLDEADALVFFPDKHTLEPHRSRDAEVVFQHRSSL
jgi:hypothetical protein